MKNFAFKILIFIVLITIISLIFFKKDYGFDTIIENNFEKIKDVSTLNNNPPASKNVTINDVDYLQSQLPIGKFGGSFVSTIMGEVKTFNPIMRQMQQVPNYRKLCMTA